MDIVGIIKLEEDFIKEHDNVKYFSPVYLVHTKKRNSKLYTRHPSGPSFSNKDENPPNNKLFIYKELKSELLKITTFNKEDISIQTDKEKLNTCDINAVLLQDKILIIGDKDYIEKECNDLLSKNIVINIDIGLIKLNLTNINYNDFINAC